ncbi:hypothetical protein JTE90_011149 [Oedothorax gibbosus]|uniref:Uncharacterized protein n=1 Tax=Oedothorax gibbosus TaxID=931172 RepID=A0AAV6TYV9_9ARAC|nr:hypothetical protein JTE90_011149 [Oedothorax gibbosus]
MIAHRCSIFHIRTFHQTGVQPGGERPPRKQVTGCHFPPEPPFEIECASRWGSGGTPFFHPHQALSGRHVCLRLT